MQTLRFKRGDTWRASFTWVQPDGNPVDLTGVVAKMQIRAQETTSPVVSIVSTQANDEIVLTPVDGLLTISVDSDKTKLIDPGVYFTDVELSYPDGSVTSTDTIKVIVAADISHD